MKKLFIFLLLIASISNSFGQAFYESAVGFTFTFDKTWKRLPKEVLQQKLKDVKEFLEYRKDIQYDACYQKIGNADMDYPYMLFKNIYATTTDEEQIKKLKDYFTNKPQFDKVMQTIANGKFDVELKIGKNYYDEKIRY
ncbi:MAG: hypothetical protein IPP81_19065 [Chitinophagaceae bacterium]|nr:hypothetical protein [Chitinophagaceae bacterium]